MVNKLNFFKNQQLKTKKKQMSLKKTATFFPVKIACISIFLNYVSNS